ncbi:MAG: LegC family aminotransferase [Bacteroidales bacterium]|jgi:aminotransferase in exopolysaccharide biosynthesis|nr:LegC family aminotransferase [Bacteroidales bacterium]
MNNADFVSFVRKTFDDKEGFIILHDPRFIGNERKYLLDAMDSNFVSSVGEYVNKFEKAIADYTGSKYAVAAVNGTSALHICLLLAGVHADEEVITQPVSFIATCNAITYTGAKPVFVDVNQETMGMCPQKLEEFLKENARKGADGYSYNNKTGKRFAAVVPMHTFGHPCLIEDIVEVCNRYNIPLVEDSAESIGSKYKGKHTGLFGKLSALSFNGNKVITTGGGGMILTQDEDLAKLAKHITTTAKVPHRWEYNHDYTAYNYRLTNLAAALGLGQIEQCEFFIQEKRKLTDKYKEFFKDKDIKFFTEPKDCRSNYWLNAVILKDRKERDEFLTYTNDNGIMTRPIWVLNNKLDMYKGCQCGDLSNAMWLEDRVVNIPSTVIIPDYYKHIKEGKYL